MDFDSHVNAKKEYQKNLIREIEKSKEIFINAIWCR